MTITHVLVVIDASEQDPAVTEVAARLATTTGVALTVMLVRTPRVLGRLEPFAVSEQLSPADAAEVYVEQVAEALRQQGIPTASVSQPADDAAAAVAAYATRYGTALILASGGGRPVRRSLAERLVKISSAPLVVVPPRTSPVAA